MNQFSVWLLALVKRLFDNFVQQRLLAELSDVDDLRRLRTDQSDDPRGNGGRSMVGVL